MGYFRLEKSQRAEKDRYGFDGVVDAEYEIIEEPKQIEDKTDGN